MKKDVFCSRFIALLLLVLCNAAFVKAQKAPAKDVAALMDKRFGLFIHFGPVTLRGTEIGWSRGDQVPMGEYDNLYKEFNPTLFNADAWVLAAKNAGMKYLTITAKHHDGFCLWPTKFSAYNISASPFKKDLVGELATACKKQGIAFCIYFSVLDWHDPDYPIHNKAASTPGNMHAYITRMKNELHELITQYHPAVLWFDGNWEDAWKKEYAQEVYAYIHTIDPHVVVNNRLGKGEHKSFSEGSVGDYLTPEQEIGQLDMTHPWESCITLCTQWAWKPNDQMKPLKECIQTLAKTAGGNGNLLLNIGPMMDGRIEARQVNRLHAMGDWLKQNGSAIYGTMGGPYTPNDIYASTRKDNKLFIHVFKSIAGFTIPALPDGIMVNKAYWLNGGSPIACKQEGSHISLNLPKALPDENCAVIVLELNKDTASIPVIKS